MNTLAATCQRYSEYEMVPRKTRALALKSRFNHGIDSVTHA